MWVFILAIIVLYTAVPTAVLPSAVLQTVTIAKDTLEGEELPVPPQKNKLLNCEIGKRVYPSFFMPLRLKTVFQTGPISADKFSISVPVMYNRRKAALLTTIHTNPVCLSNKYQQIT